MTTALMDRVEPLPDPVKPGAEIDLETLAGAQRGDSVALERFIRHYERRVFAFLSRMAGRGTHVDDLAQEVFLRAYRALPTFERREGTRVRSTNTYSTTTRCLRSMPPPTARASGSEARRRGRSSSVHGCISCPSF